jgi:hypothetical protein
MLIVILFAAMMIPPLAPVAGKKAYSYPGRHDQGHF